MSAIGIIGGILLIAVSIIITLCVTMMETKSGLGTIAGQGGGNFFDQNHAKTKEAMLERGVWILGAALVVLTFIVLFLCKA